MGDLDLDGLPLLLVASVVVVWLGLDGAAGLTFCLRWSTTAGACALGGWELAGWGTLAAGAVDVGAVEVGALGVVAGAVEVSVGVVVGAGVVDVVVDDGFVSVSWEEPPDSAAGAEPSGETGVPVPASAPLASGPPRPAAVNPPPARAESIARRARLRARFKGDIRGS